jgi:hypothetical protein
MQQFYTLWHMKATLLWFLASFSFN